MMRSSVVYAVLVSGLFFSASAEWMVETVAEMAGQMPAISLSSDGLPRIVYGKMAQGVKYSEYNGTTWSTWLVYYAYYGDCQYFDSVLDDSGMMHISFSKSGVVYYGVQDPDPAEWDVEPVYPFAYGNWTSIGLNTQGYPGISYYNNEDNNLDFLLWNGSEWIDEVVDAGEDTGNYCSLLREGGNKAYIAYSMTLPTPGLKYANRDDSGVWQTSFVDTSMTSEPIGISLARNGDGYACISYTASEELRYASWNGSSWSVETVTSPANGDRADTGANLFDTSLALDQFDHPCIAHCSLDGDSLLYSWNDGAGWQTEKVCDMPGNENTGDLDMALDSLGRPHIAFCNGPLMYAFNDTVSGVEHSEADTVPVSFNAVTNPFYGSLEISFSISQPAHVELTVYDLQGREIAGLMSETCSQGNNLFNWVPDGSVPCGEYIIVLNAMDMTFSQRAVFLR